MNKLFAILILTAVIIMGIPRAESLENSPEVIKSLEILKTKKKFVTDLAQSYIGPKDEAVWVKAEIIINDLLSDLIKISGKYQSEQQFWDILESAAKRLTLMDTEELDRGLGYMEEIMDIYGIQSSNGRLNTWRYGFDPNSVR